MIIVSNRVQIPESRTDLFIDRLKNSYGIEESTGFVELRVLKPIDAEEYITMTVWKSLDEYEAWRDGEAFERAHTDRSTDETFAAPNKVEIHEVVVERTSD